MFYVEGERFINFIFTPKSNMPECVDLLPLCCIDCSRDYKHLKRHVFGINVEFLHLKSNVSAMSNAAFV